MASNYINKGVVRSMIEKIRLCRNRGYARYIPPLKVRGLKRLIVVVSLIKRNVINPKDPMTTTECTE